MNEYFNDLFLILIEWVTCVLLRVNMICLNFYVAERIKKNSVLLLHSLARFVHIKYS